MSFFKRLSRGSRSNSYAEEYNQDGDHSPQDREKHTFHDSPHQSQSQHNTLDRQSHSRGGDSSPTRERSHDFSKSTSNSKDMYQSQSRGPQEPYALRGGGQPVNGTRATNSLSMDATQHSPAVLNPIAVKTMNAPDLLTQAFNEALRPHTERVETLEQENQDLRAWVDELEKQRQEIFAWIDKRGLRPDVPPSIAKQLDQQPQAAADLNAQLDRKITIVNFDLHRLQDDLNDSISSSHFASAMAKFLPDIARLSTLPTGPRLSFDLILKLGGNLNAHGGLEASDPADLAARKEFYAKLDTAMVDVVRRRFQESEEWPVAREIKRIEKTSQYLANFGVTPYFPSTLDTMRREVEYRGGAGNDRPISHAGQGAITAPAVNSPPRYGQ